MKQIIILLCGIVFFYCNINAQISAQLVGKKFQVVNSLKITATISQNGNDMEIPMTTDLYVTYEIKNVIGRNIQLSGTPDRIKGSSTMQGNETTYYDTNDSASMTSNPIEAEQLETLHKTKDLTAEVGKMPDMADIEQQDQFGILPLNALFNPFDKTATKGSKFSDSAKNENGSKSVTDYVVSKISDSEITVVATTNTNISGMVQNAKVNTQTKSVSIRNYDASSGLLKTATTDADTSSKQEISGMSMTTKMRTTATITVQ